MAREIWKPVPGFEGFYEASSLGRIRSVARVVRDRNPASVSGEKRLQSVVIKPFPDKNGYLCVVLYRDARAHRKKVHRLVIGAFRGEDPTRDTNHKDSNKTHNAMKNLEYATHAENVQHCVRQGRWKGPHPSQIPQAIRPDIAKVFRLHGEGMSAPKIAKAMGIGCHKTVKVILAGKHWTQREG